MGAQYNFKSTWQGAKGIAYLHNAVWELVVLDIDMPSSKEACDSLQAACQRWHIPEEPWYDWLQAMNHMGLSCLQGADEYQLFRKSY